MDNNRLLELLEKQHTNRCTPAEKEELNKWYQSMGDDQPKFLLDEASGLSKELADKKYREFLEIVSTGNTKREAPIIELNPKRQIWKVAAAAAVIILFSTGIYLWMKPISKPQTAKTDVKKETPHDIMPGGNKAILTLADGSTITLDDAKNGLIGEQGKTSILKSTDGQLAYQSADEKPNQALFNTVATPNGGQYSIVLSDGTKVWLNAASSLHFPAQFSGKERRVALTGEAYFEVVHDAEHPFVVNVNDIEVHDLGTEFNINAYYNEPSIQTTLVSGLAEVKTGNETARLAPGKAAKIIGNEIRVDNADVESVSAWKRELFQFNDADVQTIMRQIERWYDVEVIYEDKAAIAGRQITGKALRSSTLTQMIKILGLSGIHCKIEDRKLIVKP